MKVRRIIKQEMDVPGLGEKIKQARKADGRSLSAIAEACGLSRTYWYKLEAEEVDLAEDTLRAIEQQLQADFGVSFEQE